MESPRSPDAESAELANCAEEIARLVRPLEKNQQRWVDLQKNLESNDVADEVRQLGAAVVQAGLVVAANLLTALKGTGGDEPFDPDPGVLLQYHQSLPSERKRLAVWKQHAGPKPVSPIRRILEMYEEQLLEVSSLKTVAECLQRHELRKASPEVAASAPSSAPAGPGADPEHLVLLVHGIRTEAHWQERVADVIVRTGLATAQPFRYGYFDLFRFLTPGDFTRHTPVSRLHREIREISRV